MCHSFTFLSCDYPVIKEYLLNSKIKVHTYTIMEEKPFCYHKKSCVMISVKVKEILDFIHNSNLNINILNLFKLKNGNRLIELN